MRTQRSRSSSECGDRERDTARPEAGRSGTGGSGEVSGDAGRLRHELLACEHSAQDLPANAVIVNATPLGLKPGAPAPVDLARFPGTPAVYDMNYSHANTAL